MFFFFNLVNCIFFVLLDAICDFLGNFPYVVYLVCFFLDLVMIFSFTLDPLW